jgi:hypothetical protein
LNSCQTQREESPQAKLAYLIFRALGPHRSLAEAWRVYRETPPIGTLRGRPRLAHPKAGPAASGQWTAWSTRFHWAERAAQYDAQIDAEKLQTRMERIQERERQRSKVALEAQQQLQESVWRLEAHLDRMGSLPVTGFTAWEREGVTASKRHVPSINLYGYAHLVRAANRTACLAIVGLHEATDQRSRTSDDDYSFALTLFGPGVNSGTSTGRMSGESAVAYGAFCRYRDLGTKRSLVAAKKADLQNSEPATKISAGHWRDWARSWNWVARAKAYDRLVTSIERQAQRHRRVQLEERRFEFLMANQDRLESRAEKIEVLFRKAAAAPATDVTEWIVSRIGRKFHKTKTHVEGLNYSGFASVGHEYCETMRQAAGGAGPATTLEAARKLFPSILGPP